MVRFVAGEGREVNGRPLGARNGRHKKQRKRRPPPGSAGTSLPREAQGRTRLQASRVWRRLIAWPWRRRDGRLSKVLALAHSPNSTLTGIAFKVASVVI